MVTKMNHIDQCDMAFVFGNLLEPFSRDSHHFASNKIL